MTFRRWIGTCWSMAIMCRSSRLTSLDFGRIASLCYTNPRGRVRQLRAVTAYRHDHNAPRPDDTYVMSASKSKYTGYHGTCCFKSCYLRTPHNIFYHHRVVQISRLSHASRLAFLDTGRSMLSIPGHIERKGRSFPQEKRWM